MSSFTMKRFAGFAFGAAGVLGVALPSVAFADQEARFESMDTNGDGKISPDEHTAAASRLFEKLDANGDGKVTAAEMTAAHQKMVGKQGEKTEKGEIGAAEKIKKFDTNADGVLTADEHATAAKTTFDKMDTDHDGYLTKGEMKAGHDKYMHRAQAGSSRPTK